MRCVEVQSSKFKVQRFLDGGRLLTFSLALFAVLGLTGCDKAKGDKNAKGAPAGPPVIQVVAVKAEKRPVKEALSLVGTLAANESVEIKSEIDGVIQEILFQEGDVVKKGQLLVKLDETRLAALLAESEANFALSKANYERSKELLKSELISQQEYDQTVASYQGNEAGVAIKKRELKDTRIYAPFDAVVSSRNVSPGQVISKSAIITYLVDIDPVKAEFNVPERFLGQLQPGQRVELGVAAFTGKKFTGTVFFVSPFINSDTRTALVKAQLPNPNGELKPGMFANLELELALRENAIVIPEAAISQIREGNRGLVYVIGADSQVQTRALTFGVRLPRFIEVVEGLKEGEQVVVEGIQKLGPGAKVKLAPAASAEPYLWDKPAVDAAKR